MSRPKLLTIGKTLYWAIRVFNSSGVLIDADSSPTVVVRKNGAVTGDSVTVTKRSATTGIYDCSYNPAAEVEGDSFEIEETVTISAVAYANDAWVCQVIAIERGTDSVDVSGIAATVSDISDRIPSDLENGYIMASVQEGVWDELTVDHTSTGSFGYVVGLLFGLLENVTGWRFTSKALEQSPSGSGTVVVGPLVQTNAQRALPAYIETYQYSKATLGPFRIEDSEGDQFDLASQTDWIVVVWDKDDTALGTVPYADITLTSSTSNAVMDQCAFAPIAAQVATAGRHYFALRRPQGTDEQVATSGVFNVIKAPRGSSA